MRIAARLEEPAEWVMGLSFLSASFSLGRKAISQYLPEWDSITHISQLLPKAQPLGRSAAWGAFFGAYSQRTKAVFDPFRIQDVYACYTGAAGLASATMEALAGGKYWEYMDLGKPFVYFLGGAYAVQKIAAQVIPPRIPVYP